MWYEGQAMGTQVTHEEAMKWLRLMKECAYTQEEKDLIDYIQKVLVDMRNLLS